MKSSRSVAGSVAAACFLAFGFGCGGSSDELEDLAVPDFGEKADTASKSVEIKGSISFGEVKSSVFDTSKYHGYTFVGAAGASIGITLLGNKAQKTDTVVLVYGPKAGDSWVGKPIARDDNGAGDKFSKLSEFELPANGEYLIIATCRNSNYENRTYDLTLTCESDSCEIQGETCGDAVCSASEDCENCPEDCGTCEDGGDWEADAFGPCAGVRELNVVAHQDDDLLFMSPDLLRAVRGNRCVWTLYLTAGDAGGGEDYWLGRERGIKAAYAKMADLPNHWGLQFQSFGGQRLRTYRLRNAVSEIRVVFLRLPDGLPDGTGTATQRRESLQKLWTGQIDTITAVDQSQSFDRESFLDLLRTLFFEFGARTLRIMDPTGVFPGDHSDHRFSALWFQQATKTFLDGTDFFMYRGYNTADEPSNLEISDHESKWAAFLTYAAHDAGLCPNIPCSVSGAYETWGWRQYSFEAPFHGALFGYWGKCVDVPDGVTLNGTAVQLWECADVPQQRWAMNDRGEVVGSGGKCLDVRGPSSSNGTTVQIWDCLDLPQQKWQATPNGALRGFGGKCLDLRGPSKENGAQLQLWDCLDVPNQKWIWF